MQRQAAKIAEKEKIQALYFSAERKNVLVKVKENGEARGSSLSFRMKRKVGQRRGKTGGIANVGLQYNCYKVMVLTKRR